MISNTVIFENYKDCIFKISLFTLPSIIRNMSNTEFLKMCIIHML